MWGEIEKNQLVGPWVHVTREGKGPADAVILVKGSDCHSKSNRKLLKVYNLWRNKKHFKKLTLLSWRMSWREKSLDIKRSVRETLGGSCESPILVSRQWWWSQMEGYDRYLGEDSMEISDFGGFEEWGEGRT